MIASAGYGASRADGDDPLARYRAGRNRRGWSGSAAAVRTSRSEIVPPSTPPRRRSSRPITTVSGATPSAIVGAVIGTHLQGRIPRRASRLFFAGLLGLIGITFAAVSGLGLGADALP